MLQAIPLLPLGNIADAEVGCQVDHTHTGRHKLCRLLHRDAVGRGKENHIAGLETRFLRRDELQPDTPPQTGEHVRDRHAGIATRRDRHQLDLRVT